MFRSKLHITLNILTNYERFYLKPSQQGSFLGDTILQIFPKITWNQKNLDARGACIPHAPPP